MAKIAGYSKVHHSTPNKWKRRGLELCYFNRECPVKVSTNTLQLQFFLEASKLLELL